jgi:hypothetical protein
LVAGKQLRERRRQSPTGGHQSLYISFITNPAHPRFYGKTNDRRPKFGENKVLNAQEIRLVAGWLRGEPAPLITQDSPCAKN